MSKPTPVLPPLDYLPDSAKGNTIQSQLEKSNPKQGGYVNPNIERVDFYEEINQKNSRSIEKFKKAAKSNPFVPIGTLKQ
jgi:hypothetical protein